MSPASIGDGVTPFSFQREIITPAETGYALDKDARSGVALD